MSCRIYSFGVVSVARWDPRLGELPASTAAARANPRRYTWTFGRVSWWPRPGYHRYRFWKPLPRVGSAPAPRADDFNRWWTLLDAATVAAHAGLPEASALDAVRCGYSEAHADIMGRWDLDELRDDGPREAHPVHHAPRGAGGAPGGTMRARVARLVCRVRGHDWLEVRGAPRTARVAEKEILDWMFGRHTLDGTAAHDYRRCKRCRTTSPAAVDRVLDDAQRDTRERLVAQLRRESESA